MAAAGLTLPHSAQAQTTFVSNIGQADSDPLRVVRGSAWRGQQFETGGNPGGYILSEIVVNIAETSSATPAFALYTSNAHNQPLTLVVNLSGKVGTAGEQSFTPDRGTVLRASTKYFFVARMASGTASGDFVGLRSTSSNNIDSGGSSGWNIADASVQTAETPSSWDSEPESLSLEIAVKGTVAAATLSNLTLANTADDAAIDINETFAATRTRYTATAASGVAQVTVTPTKSDADAMVEFLDASGMARADANVNKTGYQVNIHEGANTIKVKVTSEDTLATQTYTLTVTRLTASCAVPVFGARRHVWTGTVTVASKSSDGNVVHHGYSSVDNPDTGSIDDATFNIGVNDYTIDVVTVDAAGGSNAGDLVLSLASSSLTTNEKAALQLHVCDTAYAFNDALGPSGGHTYRWDVNNLDWAMVSPRTLHLSLPANNKATGTPTIGGYPVVVGQELFARISTGIIEDADGLSNLERELQAGYTFQWVRVDGHTETNIDGAKDRTYALTAADAGKQVKVEVSFFDDLGAEETIESDPVTVLSDDATLSALTLANATDDEAIPLNETFAATRTRYTATAASGVTRVTVTPTKSHAGAAIEYLGASNMALADANPDKTGQQVNIDVGVNTIKVKVTSEDNRMTQTYTLTVTRSPASCPVPDFGTRRHVWTGTVTAADAPLAGVRGFSAEGSGSIDPTTTFSIGENTYTIETLGVYVMGNPSAGNLAFFANDGLTTTEVAALRLHVCDTPYDFSAASHGSQVRRFLWELDLDWSTVTTRTLHLSLPANSKPTGAPLITGTAAVGGTLTATLGNLRDADGQPDPAAFPAGYTFQWVRVDGGSEINIEEMGTSQTYTPTAADLDKRLKVTVRFTDDFGTMEEKTSPASVTVTMGGTSTCLLPSLGTRRQIWIGTVTVASKSSGDNVVHYGFSSVGDPDTGSIDDATFSIGANDYTIDAVTVDAAGGSNEGDLELSLASSDLTTAEKAALQLHVCDTAYDFNDALVPSGAHTYRWDVDTLDWAMVMTRTLRLSLPANNYPSGMPVITGTATVGQTLTAAMGTIADADGLPDTFPDDYTFQWVRVDGATETNIATTQTYVLTDDDGEKQVKVQVGFTDDFNGEETVGSDPVSVPSADATLSNLAIADATDDEAIPLNETFAADVTSYTANVAHAVTRITVTPTKNHVNAAIDHLDGSDNDHTDAHTKPGHQVDLAVGDTTIKVKVTAEDTTTTRTYTLTVTRAAADAPPKLVAQPHGAVVDRASLVLTFDEDLDPGSVPSDTGGFTLTVRRGDPPQPVSTPPAVTGVTVSGKTATLALSTGVLFGDTVTLSYAPPAANPLQDAESNKVAAFSDRPVNNSTADDPPPKLVAQPDGAVVDRASLVLTFDEDLDPGSVPSGTGGFTLTVRRGDPPQPVSTPPAVTGVTVSGKTAALTLSTGVLFGDTVTLSYAPPAANPLQDAEGNKVATFSDQAVKNNTAQGPATAPGAPLNLQARPRDGEVALSWEPPSDTGNRPVERYELRYAAGASVPSSTPWTDVGLSLDRLVLDLTNGRQHTFEVRAVNSANRTGRVASVRATPEVDANAPCRPRHLRTLFERDGHVVLIWSEPVCDGGSPIIHYEYRHAKGTSVPADTPWTRSDLSTTRDVNLAGAGKLTNGQPYTFEVRAVAEVAGPAARVTATPRREPAAGVPSAPRNLRVTFSEPYLKTGGGAAVDATVRWDPSSNAGNVQGTYQFRFAAGVSVPADTTWGNTGENLGTGRVGLKPSTTYTFEVRRTNSLGASPATRREAMTPAYTGPSVSVFVRGTAREGAPFTIGARRTGKTDGDARVIIELLDSAFPTTYRHKLVELPDGVSSATTTFTPAYDNMRPTDRTLSLRVSDVPDGYDFGAPARLTVDVSDDDAGLRIANASVREATDATLTFTVRLDRTVNHDVTVNYATADGTATQGMDYTAKSGTLTIPAGDRRASIEIEVLDDALNEGSETLTVTLSDARGAIIETATATGTIINTDSMPEAWLARFGRTVGSQVLEAVSQRLDGAPSPHVTVGGVNFGAPPPLDAEAPAPSDWLAERMVQGPQAPQAEERTLTGRDLLLGSSFHLVSQGEERDRPALSAWGRVSTGGFQAEVNDVSLGGDVTTGFLGFDAEWERLLAGVLVGRNEGDGAYRLQNGDDSGRVETTLTGIYPYARLRLGGRLSVWGLAGMGSGDLRLARPDETFDTGLGLRLGALGVRGALPTGGVLELAVKSDVLWVRTDSDAVAGLAAAVAQVGRVRLILEAGRTLALSPGAVLAPTAQIGLRHDGGDAETGTGVEVGAGLRYTAGLLSVEGQVRTLLAHEADGYQEWGASGSIRLSPNASGLGPSLAVLPSWGSPGSGVARLWSQPDASAPGAGGALGSPPGRLGAELGYGLPALRGRGVLTPYARLDLAEHAGQSWHLGTRLALAESFALSLEGSRRQAGDTTAHDLALRLSAQW